MKIAIDIMRDFRDHGEITAVSNNSSMIFESNCQMPELMLAFQSIELDRVKLKKNAYGYLWYEYTNA